MKKEALFNVIIPTRERADTLFYTLQTAVSQNYENLNIIVSDNFSQDKTKDVVASFVDERIKYINTGKRISMSHNWEFALSHVKDGYVFFMGDDDGLLPNAIQKANQLLTKDVSDALTWKKAIYMWPDYIDPVGQNSLMMPLRKGVKTQNCKKMLERVCNFDFSSVSLFYEFLPGLYNSFVSISAINKARDRSGKFFCSQIPDVYSAIALTSSIDSYVYSNSPLSINGVSGHSNGKSYFTNPNFAAAVKFSEEDNMSFHPDVLLSPSIPLIVAESVWQARDNIPGCEDYDVNLEKLFVETRRLSALLPEASRELINAALDRVREARNINIESETISDPSLQPAINGYSYSFLKQAHRRINKYMDFIYHYEKKLPVGEVSNVYEASEYCQELEKRRLILLPYRTLQYINSIVVELMHRIFKPSK